jgi:hypothetical protein
MVNGDPRDLTFGAFREHGDAPKGLVVRAWLASLAAGRGRPSLSAGTPLPPPRWGAREAIAVRSHAVLALVSEELRQGPGLC